MPLSLFKISLACRGEAAGDDEAAGQQDLGEGQSQSTANDVAGVAPSEDVVIPPMTMDELAACSAHSKQRWLEV